MNVFERKLNILFQEKQSEKLRRTPVDAELLLCVLTKYKSMVASSTQAGAAAAAAALQSRTITLND